MTWSNPKSPKLGVENGSTALECGDVEFGALDVSSPHARAFLRHFRYFNPLRQRWLTARYVAEREVIAGRYGKFEIIGEPEVRQVSADPYANSASHLGRRQP